jgi:hypothetical protein
MARLE